tara:strand:- start:569 stop:793 length:225 start_codon:yes stop_codon:yes gene_type:complete
VVGVKVCQVPLVQWKVGELVRPLVLRREQTFFWLQKKEEEGWLHCLGKEVRRGEALVKCGGGGLVTCNDELPVA